MTATWTPVFEGRLNERCTNWVITAEVKSTREMHDRNDACGYARYRVSETATNFCTAGHEPGRCPPETRRDCIPPADPLNQRLRLLRAIYGLCVDCDETADHWHCERCRAAHLDRSGAEFCPACVQPSCLKCREMLTYNRAGDLADVYAMSPSCPEGGMHKIWGGDDD